MSKSRAVEMFVITVPLDAIRRLSPERRFTYYMLGHMFNELMCLQKLISYSLPKHEDKRPARLRPELGQAMFLFRLASGKIWEASKAIRESKQLAQTLLRDILPQMEGGKERLKSLNAAVNDAEWLSPLRNGLGFHFPTYDQWTSHLTPDESWIDDVIFSGEQSGNTWHDGADSVSQAFMFHHYGALDLKDAVDPLIGQMIKLLGMMNSFLEDALAAFVSDFTRETPAKRELVGKVLAPEFKSIATPFWTAMPSKHS